MAEPIPSRLHCARLMQVWRSAGWPCKDGIEIDLLAAQLLRLQTSTEGHESLRLTEAGIRVLAEARKRAVRSASPHDRLAAKFAALLKQDGRIVWRELQLRARIEPQPAPTENPPSAPPARLWDAEALESLPAAHVWRMARPDLYSVRNTTVETYLQPMVHEVKFSRADLLSDLRHEAKRLAYRWLCSECYYVFPAAVAGPDEIPEPFGVWVHHGDLESGRFEMLRPARPVDCALPFAVWMALAKATPMHADEEAAQAELGAELNDLP